MNRGCQDSEGNFYLLMDKFEITPEIKLEIEQIITAASNGSKARLADNVFTNESTLMIEKKLELSKSKKILKDLVNNL